MISAYALGVVVGAPVIAAMTAKLNRKAVLLSLMVLFTVGNLATVFAPNYAFLIGARFLAGLPHGAFFGVAALVAARLLGPGRRAKAVAQVMTGLTVATVIGVPFASWLGQTLGWRSAFALVVVIGMATLTAIAAWLPNVAATHATSALTELGALKRTQVWFALVVGMVGFGGMFAVYTYVVTTLTDVAGLQRALVPLALMVFGGGMVVGNLLGGRMADRSVIRGLYAALVALAIVLGVFVVASHNPYSAVLLLFGIGAAGGSTGPCSADPADGRRRGRPDPRRCAESLRAQHRQRIRRLDRRAGDRGRLWLHRACGCRCAAGGHRAGRCSRRRRFCNIGSRRRRRSEATDDRERGLPLRPRRAPATVGYHAIPSLCAGGASTLGEARASHRDSRARLLELRPKGNSRR